MSSLFNKEKKLKQMPRTYQISREPSQNQVGFDCLRLLISFLTDSFISSAQFGGIDDRSIVERLQDIVAILEAQLQPLVQAEYSVIVDVLYRPECLFPRGNDARRKCDHGGFIRRHVCSTINWVVILFDFICVIIRLIKHTERLLEDKEEKLCIQVLNTLREMMNFDVQYGDKVSWSCLR